MARQCSEPRPSGWGPRRPVWDQGCRPRTTLSTTPFAQLSRCLSPLSRPPVQMKSTPRSASRERKCSRYGGRQKSGQREEKEPYLQSATMFLSCLGRVVQRDGFAAALPTPVPRPVPGQTRNPILPAQQELLPAELVEHARPGGNRRKPEHSSHLTNWFQPKKKFQTISF